MSELSVQTPQARKMNLQTLLAPAVLVVMYIFFAIFGKNFFSGYTLKTILESAYYTGLMSFGITFVIITGGIDLSIGTNLMCSAIVGGVAYSMWGWPLWLALCLVPLVGLSFGLLNGVLVAKAKLPPFIATLGMMLVTQGFGSIISNVQTQRYPTIGTKDAWFKQVFYRSNTLADFLPLLIVVSLAIVAFLLVKMITAPRKSKQKTLFIILFIVSAIFFSALLILTILFGSVIQSGQFPIGALYLLFAFVVAAFILSKTKFGRYVYAIGSNEEATRLSGVKVDKYKIFAYAVCGLFCGFGAIFFASTYTTATPGTGNGFETYAIAAVIIGGTSMAGGSGNMVGTLIGIFIMAVLKAGLSSLGLQAHWQTFFTGLVVIGAVLMDNMRSRLGQKKA